MKVTVETMFEVYQEESTGKWKAKEIGDREICCDFYDADKHNEWDCFLYGTNIVDDIFEKVSEKKEGNYWYYVEFNCYSIIHETMDGTEYDVEYEEDLRLVTYLGE